MFDENLALTWIVRNLDFLDLYLLFPRKSFPGNVSRFAFIYKFSINFAG